MAPKKKADDKPAIFAAIDKGDDDTLQELLSADPGIVNLRNKDGWTPLISASYCGEIDMVHVLIKAGADVRATCRDGDTALHYASAQGHADVITALAKNGAKLDVKDKDGETPYNVAGKNMKIRKLITQLLETNLDDGSDEENGKLGNGDADGDDDEWEEVDEDEQGKIV